MGEKTMISWCRHTFNLWWGCEHASADDPTDSDLAGTYVRTNLAAISEECRHCYAETFDHRLGGQHWGHGAEPRWQSDAYWSNLAKWNAAAARDGERRRVFVSSMSDWAQRHPVAWIDARMDHERARLYSAIARCEWLDFLLLTKRAERLRELLPWTNLAFPDGGSWHGGKASDPWPNVWVGVTCGTRRSLWRIGRLRAVPAAVRFVSAEPLLDRITAEEWDAVLGRWPITRNADGADPTRVDWLIVGDESGHGRRAIGHDAIATARDAAERHGVAFHLKQLHDEAGRKVHLPVFEGRVHDAAPGR